MEIKAQTKDGTIHFDPQTADDVVKVVSKPDPDQNGWH